MDDVQNDASKSACIGGTGTKMRQVPWQLKFDMNAEVQNAPSMKLGLFILVAVELNMKHHKSFIYIFVIFGKKCRPERRSLPRERLRCGETIWKASQDKVWMAWMDLGQLVSIVSSPRYPKD